MKVQAINNNDSNPNFGIKYVRPNWMLLRALNW